MLDCSAPICVKMEPEVSLIPHKRLPNLTLKNKAEKRTS